MQSRGSHHATARARSNAWLLLAALDAALGCSAPNPDYGTPGQPPREDAADGGLDLPPAVTSSPRDARDQTGLDAAPAPGGQADGPGAAPPPKPATDGARPPLPGADAPAAATADAAPPPRPPADAAPAPGPDVRPADPAQYGFESGVDGWTDLRGAGTALRSVTTQAFAGARSLEVKLQTGGSGDRYVGIAGLTPLAALRAGATVTFRFWFPAAAPLAGVQPFVQYVPPGGKPGSPTWIGTWKDKVALTPGAWNTITVQVPSGSQGAVELGIQWRLSSAWTGLVYVDAVAW